MSSPTPRRVDVGSADHIAELDLRYRVLRQPLGRERGSEVYAHEADCLHYVAVDERDRVIGCVVFHPQGPHHGRLLQMAVDPSCQGQGVGRVLVDALEKSVAGEGFRRVVLHSRDHAIGFYERLGYVCFGEPYEEVGVPHRNMQRTL